MGKYIAPTPIHSKTFRLGKNSDTNLIINYYFEGGFAYETQEIQMSSQNGCSATLAVSDIFTVDNLRNLTDQIKKENLLIPNKITEYKIEASKKKVQAQLEKDLADFEVLRTKLGK